MSIRLELFETSRTVLRVLLIVATSCLLTTVAAKGSEEFPLENLPGAVVDTAHEPQTGMLIIVGPWDQAVGILSVDSAQPLLPALQQIPLFKLQGNPTTVTCVQAAPVPRS